MSESGGNRTPNDFTPATAGPPVSGLPAAPGGIPSSEPWMASTLDCLVAIRASALTSTQRLVLLMLAARAFGDQGEFYGGNTMLVDDTGLSERCIRDTLRELQVAGILLAEHPEGRRATTYRVVVEKIPNRAAARRAEQAARDAAPEGAAGAGQPAAGAGSEEEPEPPGGHDVPVKRHVVPVMGAAGAGQPAAGAGQAARRAPDQEVLQVSEKGSKKVGPPSRETPGVLLAPKTPPKAPTPQMKTPEKTAVLNLWGSAFTATTGETYPWGGDKGYRQALAHATDILAVIGDVSPPKLERLRQAIEGYLENPHPWAKGKTEDQGRTLRDFTRQAQDRWTRLASVRPRDRYATPPLERDLPPVDTDIPY